MKKKGTQLLAFLLALAMLLVPMSSVHAEEDAGVDTAAFDWADGSYEITSWSITGGSGKRTFTMAEKLTVADGVPYVTFAIDSDKYTTAKIGEQEYVSTVDESAGKSSFTVPVTLGEEMTVSLYTTAMSGAWIDYTLMVEASNDTTDDTTDDTPVETSKWKDGTYVATASVSNATGPEGVTVSSYPKTPYTIDVVVTIGNGKIASVRYKDALPASDSNAGYQKWAMDGCYYYYKDTATWDLDTGIAAQVVASQSTEDLDVVSGATHVFYGVQYAIEEALAKAEVGDTTDVDPITEEEDNTADTVLPTGVYTVDDVNNLGCDISILDAKVISKYGKMTAVLRLKYTSRDIICFGTVEEAMAGTSTMYAGTEFTYSKDDGSTGTGYEFELPLESVDKEYALIIHSKSKSQWTTKAITFPSDALTLSDESAVGTYQDGTYVGTSTVTSGKIADGSTTKYPKTPYEMNVVVEIKDGKIASVRYKDALSVSDSNMSYQQWAMDGCNFYDEETKIWTYAEGIASQVAAANSADEIDVVTGSTRASYGIQEAVWNALAKAEVGDTSDVDPIPEGTETPNTVIDSGVYKAENVVCDLSIVDAQLTSKDGKMTALITVGSTARDIIYFGTETEAKAAGESAWSIGTEVKYMSGDTEKTGLQFEIPVESVDKELSFVIHAVSSNKWNVKTIQFNSSDLVKIADVEDSTNSGTTNPDTPNTDTTNPDTPSTDTTNPDTNKTDTNKSEQSTNGTGVKTGDAATMMYVWACVLVLSAVCAVVLINRKRNRA